MDSIEIHSADIAATVTCARWARLDRTKAFDSFERLVAFGTVDALGMPRIELRSVLAASSSADVANAPTVSPCLASVEIPASATALHWTSPTHIVAATSAGHLLAFEASFTSAAAALNGTGDEDLSTASPDSDAAPSASATLTLLSTLPGLHSGAGVCSMAVNGPLMLTAGEDNTLTLTILPVSTTSSDANPASASAATADLSRAGGARGRVIATWDNCFLSLPTVISAPSPDSDDTPVVRATLGAGLAARGVRFTGPLAALTAGEGGRVLRWDLSPLTATFTSLGSGVLAAEGGVGSMWGPVSAFLPPPLLPTQPLPALGPGVPTVTCFTTLPASAGSSATGGLLSAASGPEAELLSLAAGCADGSIALWRPTFSRAAVALLPASTDAAAAAGAGVGAGAGAGAVTEVAFVPWDTTRLLYCTANGYIGIYYVAAGASSGEKAAAGKGLTIEFAGLLLGDPLAGAGATAGGLPVGRLDFDSATQHVVAYTGQGKVVHFALPVARR